MATLSEQQAQWSSGAVPAPDGWERAGNGTWYPTGHTALTTYGAWTGGTTTTPTTSGTGGTTFTTQPVGTPTTVTTSGTAPTTTTTPVSTAGLSLSEQQALWSAGTVPAPDGWERAGNGKWYPTGHTALTTYGLWGASAPTGGTPPAPVGSTPTGGDPMASNIARQADLASTYAANAGAAPQKYTANAGTQDVVRNSYLQQATQGTNIDRNDPNFRQQADAFAAGVERQRRDYLADRAESLGPYQTGALRGESRMAAERAGQAIGGFEAELVGRELQNRRDEIQRALTAMTGILGSDQQAQLQRDLANIEAELKKLGFDTQEDIAEMQDDTQRDLGFEGLDLDWAKLKAQKDQFADELAYRILQEENRYSDPWFPPTTVYSLY